MLDLNITVLIQMVNFFIALYVLNALLIKPIRAILQERRAKMDDLSGTADAFLREAKERLDDYEAKLAKARQEGAVLRENARVEGATKQQEIVADAGRLAQAELAKANEKFKAEATATLSELKKEVSGLADKLATRVMG